MKTSGIMKRVLTAFITGLLLVGCGSNNQAAQAANNASGGGSFAVTTPEPSKAPQKTAEPDTDDDDDDPLGLADYENPLLAKGSVRDGMDGIGYIDLPKSWESDHDDEDPAYITLRWWSKDGDITLAMYSFNEDELLEFEDEVVYEPDFWVFDDIEGMKEDYGDLIDNVDEDIIEGGFEIGFYDGWASTIFFNDNTTFTSIAFMDEYGTMHIVNIETLSDESLDALQDLTHLIADTFSVEK